MARRLRYHMTARTRGPTAVFQSLERGLREINFNYLLNKKPQDGDVLHVLSGIETVKEGIRLKRSGKIKKLLVGPNIVTTPTEHGSILGDPSIDAVLLPSQWTKDFYSAEIPCISNKIYIWPSGVQIPKSIDFASSRTGCIIYRKVVDDIVYNKVIEELELRSIPHTFMVYGAHTQKEYFQALEKAEFMIYLQEVESQGLALQEAWARNVPTLVWNKGFFVYKTGEMVKGNISAPYLTARSGRSFSSEKDFGATLTDFMQNLSSFDPRAYCMEYLSDKVSAEIYVRIVESVGH